MPVFAAAPRILKDGLIFPYLAGADFVRWFSNQFPDTVPFGPRMPQSTEQILRFDRYRVGDTPLELVFSEDDGALHTDNLGQFEIQILLTEWTSSESTARGGAFGWAGDRYGNPASVRPVEPEFGRAIRPSHPARSRAERRSCPRCLPARWARRSSFVGSSRCQSRRACPSLFLIKSQSLPLPCPRGFILLKVNIPCNRSPASRKEIFVSPTSNNSNSPSSQMTTAPAP